MLKPLPLSFSWVLFGSLWLFAIAVSVYDGYLLVINRDQMLTAEQNPVGRWLIALNHGGVWYLLAAKFLGTIVSCAIMLALARRTLQMGVLVAAGVAIAQFALLLVLTLG
jgi:hypothetical protein